MRNKLGLLIASFLFVLAFGLYVLLFRFVLIEMLYRFFAEGTTGLRDYLYKVARSVDQTANATYPVLRTITLLSWWDLSPDWHRFGNEDVTISMVLHINKLDGNLSIIGDCLWWVLESLDPGHGEESIEG